LVTDSHSILARCRKRVYQLWNVRVVDYVRHSKIYTTRPLLAIENQKHISPDTDNIPAVELKAES
jgi:hypothetical protein